MLVYDIRNSRYVNLTNSCTLKCAFCPKTKGSPQVHEYNLGIEEHHQANDYIDAIGDPTKFDEIVFCGFGEPTMRLKVLLLIARAVKEKGGKVRINTDGLANLVHKRNVLPEMAKYIDALSVSLNGQNEEIYNKHCVPGLKASFQGVLDFLTLAPDYIADTTATAIDGLEGLDIKACEQLALDRGVKFRRRVLDVVG
ncbi:MAG: radical SAM protein [Gammaproteobacteria bacterium]|nr:radical SAM protein [Gammaproteobacteria bacterium]